MSQTVAAAFAVAVAVAVVIAVADRRCRYTSESLSPSPSPLVSDGLGPSNTANVDRHLDVLSENITCIYTYPSDALPFIQPFSR